MLEVLGASVFDTVVPQPRALSLCAVVHVALKLNHEVQRQVLKRTVAGVCYVLLVAFGTVSAAGVALNVLVKPALKAFLDLHDWSVGWVSRVRRSDGAGKGENEEVEALVIGLRDIGQRVTHGPVARAHGLEHAEQASELAAIGQLLRLTARA